MHDNPVKPVSVTNLVCKKPYLYHTFEIVWRIIFIQNKLIHEFR